MSSQHLDKDKINILPDPEASTKANTAFSLLYVLLFALFLMPNHNISYLLMIGSLGLILLNALIKDGRLVFAIMIVWCYVLNSTLVKGVYDLDYSLVVKVVFLSLMVVSTLAVDRPFLFKGVTEKHFRQLHYFMFFLACMLVASQFVLIYKISPISDFILNVYMTDDVFASLYKGEIRVGQERSGGLFINPNQMAKAMSFVLVMAGITLSLGKSNSNSIFYATFAVLSIGVFVSGSRTGLLTIAFIFFLWNLKYLTVLKVILFFLGVIAIVFLQASFSADSRVLSTDESAVGSLFYKLDFVALYLSKSNFVDSVLGHGLNSYHQAIEGLSVGGLNFGFDADIGYSTFHFGLLGTAVIAIYFGLMKWRHSIPGYVFGIMLWVITSSIFFNIRGIATLTAVFILLNLKITSESKKHAE